MSKEHMFGFVAYASTNTESQEKKDENEEKDKTGNNKSGMIVESNNEEETSGIEVDFFQEFRDRVIGIGHILAMIYH